MIVSVVYDINRSRSGQGEYNRLDIVVVRQTFGNELAERQMSLLFQKVYPFGIEEGVRGITFFGALAKWSNMC